MRELDLAHSIKGEIISDLCNFFTITEHWPYTSQLEIHSRNIHFCTVTILPEFRTSQCVTIVSSQENVVDICNPNMKYEIYNYIAIAYQEIIGKTISSHFSEMLKALQQNPLL